MKRALLLSVAVALVPPALGCAKESTGKVEGPPLTIADAGPPPIAASTTPSAGPAAPVKAFFQPVEASGITLTTSSCDRVLVHVVKGRVEISGEPYAAGDTIMLSWSSSVMLRGAGLVVVVQAPRAPCTPPPRQEIEKTVIKGTAAPKLEWAFGTMSAHLDVEKIVSPEVYLGRLEGTAAVAEHVHATSWEILCAVEAQGTFTLDGKEQRLSGASVVVVPPNTKHSWKPDPGTKLVGVQIYTPPGPEQRFKLLAEQPDAGPR